MNPEKISKIIKEIRLKSGMTQKEFADKYNVTYQAVSKWENAKNLPDVSILKEICQDFNLDINELLGNEINKKKSKGRYLAVIGFAIVIILLIAVFVIMNHNKDFEFKTLSTSCDNFTVSGTISYSDKKSAIYISNVTYCGGDDETEYDQIECTLYEKDGDVISKISSFKENRKKMKIEEFLKNVNFTIDNYKSVCKKYDNESLFLSIKATVAGKATNYDIPLALNDECN